MSDEYTKFTCFHFRQNSRSWLYAFNAVKPKLNDVAYSKYDNWKMAVAVFVGLQVEVQEIQKSLQYATQNKPTFIFMFNVHTFNVYVIELSQIFSQVK